MRDAIGELPTPYSHVDNEYGTKTKVYNRKRNGKRVEGKEKEKKRLKKYNSIKKRRTLNH